MRKIIIYAVVAVLAIACGSAAWKHFSGLDKGAEIKKQVIKIGYFPNITHSPAVAGMASGKIQEILGDNIIIEAKIFNAGPSEIEALYAGEIDIGYIGPSPAVNGYIKANGEALNIVSGVSLGGASLVVQPELYSAYQVQGAKALEGKKIASPQQGNTQDISLRHYIKENNLTGKTAIVPIANADQLTMFALKQLDGAWAPEPWASRLVVEAGGKRLIDERDLWPDKKFCTTNIIVSNKFFKEHPELVKKWLEANARVIAWINADPAEAQAIVNLEIERLTTKKLPEEVLAEAWRMLSFDINPVKDSVITFANWAYNEGFLGEKQPDLANLYELSMLNEIANTKY